MKIVLDATVLIRAHNRSKALARRLLHEILERGHRLVLSNEMINEAVKVLRYPELSKPPSRRMVCMEMQSVRL